jgi:dipeptidyl aminopeptidase/acylaminoacyl peptidase
MAQPREPFAIEDILLEQRISDLHVLRDGTLAVCSVSAIDQSADGYVSALWTFRLDGSECRQVTRGPGRDDFPRWAPDGQRIAFIGDRHGGAPQLYVIDISGGEARQLTHFEATVVDHAWRPDGRQLLALIEVQVDPEKRAAGCDEVADLQRKPRSDPEPEVIWRLPYKADGKGYTLAQRTHLFLVDADSGEATQLTRGDFDVGGMTWSPDGRHVAYTRKRSTPREAHCSDLWLLAMGDDGSSGKPQRVSREQSMVSGPSWSPDGRRIAFIGSRQAGDAQMSLWHCEVQDGHAGPVRQLGDASIEVAPSSTLAWHGDSGSLWFIRAHRGVQRIARITVPGGEVTQIERGVAHVMHMTAHEARIVFSQEAPDRPMELHACDHDGGNAVQLSRFNPWWDERIVPQVVLRSFEVPDGDGGTELVDGWLLLPGEGAEATKPYPLLVDVHGGPAAYVDMQFPAHAYRQLLCARGWAVLALNAVGSASYGRDFSERLRERWGELDLPQHLAAVDTLRQEGIAGEQLAISGSSYGGYLAAWAIGKTREFRAAVVCAPVGNLETHFGTSDSGYYADPYSMRGKPEADRRLMFELSPMAHIEHAVTPTLFLQGMDDERCPKCQSEEMFVKLRTSGVEACEMVLYPGGSHHVFGDGKPSHRQHVLKHQIGWLERWVAQRLPQSQGSDPPPPHNRGNRDETDDAGRPGGGVRRRALPAEAEEPARLADGDGR